MIIATPHEWHAEMAVKALKAHKFVGSEVPACNTVDECRQILRAQRETGMCARQPPPEHQHDNDGRIRHRWLREERRSEEGNA